MSDYSCVQVNAGRFTQGHGTDAPGTIDSRFYEILIKHRQGESDDCVVSKHVFFDRPADLDACVKTCREIASLTRLPIEYEARVQDEAKTAGVSLT